MTRDQDEVFELRLDWALGEREGRATPPDVVDAVMAQLDPAAAAPRRATSTWLVAALVLLGVGAVFAVSWAKNGSAPWPVDPNEAGAPTHQDPFPVPAFVEVRDVADIDALPQGTAAVALIGLDDASVEQLRRRFRYLHSLRLDGGAFTKKSYFEAASFHYLRYLDVAGCPSITGADIADIIANRVIHDLRLGHHVDLSRDHIEALCRQGFRVRFKVADHPLQAALDQLAFQYSDVCCDRIGDAIDHVRYLQAGSLADVDMLPSDAIAVDGTDLDDAAVAALSRLAQLRYLRLRSGVQTEQLLVLDGVSYWAPRTDERNRRSVTDDGLAALASLGALETLELIGTVDVKGPGLQHLARLPRLRELQLICQDTSDAGLQNLPSFPALRRLVIERNHGFSAAGMQAIGQCGQLQGVVLAACPQLHTQELLWLRGCTRLEELRLRQLDAWRNDSKRELTTAEAAVLAHARELGLRPERGITDTALKHAVSALSNLRALELTFSSATHVGFESLRQLTLLQDVKLVGNAGFTTSCLQNLTPAIVRLDISGCEQVDATVGNVISRCFPQLEELRMGGNDRVTDIEPILTMPTLRVLDVRGCHKLTAAMVPHFEQAKQLRELDITGCVNLPRSLAAALGKRGVAVTYKIW